MNFDFLSFLIGLLVGLCIGGLVLLVAYYWKGKSLEDTDLTEEFAAFSLNRISSQRFSMTNIGTETAFNVTVEKGSFLRAPDQFPRIDPSHSVSFVLVAARWGVQQDLYIRFTLPNGKTKTQKLLISPE